jgi:hypothetical protein
LNPSVAATMAWPSALARRTRSLVSVHLSERLSSLSPLVTAAIDGLTGLRAGEIERPSGVSAMHDPRGEVVTELWQPNRKLTPAEVDELVIAYLAGGSIIGVGRRFGVHEQTVKAHLKRRGIAVRQQRLGDDQVSLVLTLAESELSMRGIAREVGISVSAVSKLLRGRDGGAVQP